MLNSIREYQREQVPKTLSAEDWVSECSAARNADYPR